MQDGYESQFQVNYLGHFLLAYLMRPILESTGTPDSPARVVIISSLSSEKGTLKDHDIEKVARREEADYNAMAAYRDAKVWLVLEGYQYAFEWFEIMVFMS